MGETTMFHRLTVTICAVAALIVLTVSFAAATEITTGSISVVDQDFVQCIAPNAGTGNISRISIRIQFNDLLGADNGGVTQSCTNVAPNTTCVHLNAGVNFDHNAFCEITFGSGKVRGTFCNLTKGLCADAR